MDNGGKNEAFFTGLLNKTRKDKNIYSNTGRDTYDGDCNAN